MSLILRQDTVHHHPLCNIQLFQYQGEELYHVKGQEELVPLLLLTGTMVREAVLSHNSEFNNFISMLFSSHLFIMTNTFPIISSLSPSDCPFVLIYTAQTSILLAIHHIYTSPPLSSSPHSSSINLSEHI